MGFDKGEKKAIMLFNDHMEEFSQFLGSYRKRNGEKGLCYYFENYSKYSWTKITYMSTKKLLSKTYFIDFTFVIDNLDMKDDWQAKLIFTGAIKMTGAKLKYISGDKLIINKLNEDLELMEGVLKCSKKVDIYSMTLEYVSRTRQLKVIITPYNGGYLWIKFPPVFYPMRLSTEEVYTLCELMNFLGKSFIKKRQVPSEEIKIMQKRQRYYL